MRADPASELFGVRFNLLLSALICVLSAIWFWWLGRHGTGTNVRATAPDGAERGVDGGEPAIAGSTDADADAGAP